jgi:hypothetical protein
VRPQLIAKGAVIARFVQPRLSEGKFLFGVETFGDRSKKLRCFGEAVDGLLLSELFASLRLSLSLLGLHLIGLNLRFLGRHDAQQTTNDTEFSWCPPLSEFYMRMPTARMQIDCLNLALIRIEKLYALAAR